MVVRLAHVCIETDDFEPTEEFYSHLGINRQFEFRNKQNELVGVYLNIGETTYIEIIKVKKPKSEGNMRHFALQVDDVEETRTLLISKGVEVTEKELGIDHTLMVTCHDPNGNFIEFHQYTDKSMQQHGGVCEIDYTPS
jgi:catechol 2,3-dioxygenase-like lactoylglutathione lyase family enzyme